MGWFWIDNTDFINCKNTPTTDCSDNQKNLKIKEYSNTKNVDILTKINEKIKLAFRKSVENFDEVNSANLIPKNLDTPCKLGNDSSLSKREISSIPNGSSSEKKNWVYPSHRQMYNALERKNKSEGINKSNINEIVDIHNFLNEKTWEEIKNWETRFKKNQDSESKLLSFMGLSNTLSLKARFLLFLGSIFPNNFNTLPPFDRHDWIVLRTVGTEKKKSRYIIDYYSGPPDEKTQHPTFYLDIRPALDDLESIKVRFIFFVESMYNKFLKKN